jgi:dihydropyrimidinase
MEVTGLASTTISQGRIVWHKGELRAVKGAGRYINRPCFPASVEALSLVNAMNKPVGVAR